MAHEELKGLPRAPQGGRKSKPGAHLSATRASPSLSGVLLGGMEGATGGHRGSQKHPSQEHGHMKEPKRSSR